MTGQALHADGPWKVFLDDELLGEVVVEEYDEPYSVGAFRAEPAYESVQALFAAEAALSDSSDDRGELTKLWDAVYSELKALGLRLVDPSGSPVPYAIVHLSPTRARFKCFSEAPPVGYRAPSLVYAVEHTREGDTTVQLGALTSLREAEKLLNRLRDEGWGELHVNYISVHHSLADWEWDR